MGLDVQVTRIRSVSGDARVMLGTLAGRDAVVGTETLTDLRGPTPRTLHSFTTEAASASHPFSGESSLNDAHRQFATNTIAALRS